METNCPLITSSMQTSLKTLARLGIVTASRVKETQLIITFDDGVEESLDLTAPNTSNILEYTAQMYQFREEEWD